VGREELALLDVDRLAALRHRADEVGLAAEEGRRLQRVDDRGRGGDLVSRCTSVITGTPSTCFTLARISRPLSMPGPRNDVPLERFALS
jgi:hypothetical protein